MNKHAEWQSVVNLYLFYKNARTSSLKYQVPYERDATDPVPKDDVITGLDGIFQKQLELRRTNNRKNRFKWVQISLVLCQWVSTSTVFVCFYLYLFLVGTYTLLSSLPQKGSSPWYDDEPSIIMTIVHDWFLLKFHHNLFNWWPIFIAIMTSIILMTIYI